MKEQLALPESCEENVCASVFAFEKDDDSRVSMACLVCENSIVLQQNSKGKFQLSNVHRHLSRCWLNDAFLQNKRERAKYSKTVENLFSAQRKRSQAAAAQKVETTTQSTEGAADVIEIPDPKVKRPMEEETSRSEKLDLDDYEATVSFRVDSSVPVPSQSSSSPLEKRLANEELQSNSGKTLNLLFLFHSNFFVPPA